MSDSLDDSRPAYDWPNAVNFALIVAACLASWAILALIWRGLTWILSLFNN